MIAPFVYALCLITAALCAGLLFRNSRNSRTRLLFWSGAAFISFAFGNVLLFVDLAVVPQYDLLMLRTLTTTIGVFMLLYGLIWETE